MTILCPFCSGECCFECDFDGEIPIATSSIRNPDMDIARAVIGTIWSHLPAPIHLYKLRSALDDDRPEFVANFLAWKESVR